MTPERLASMPENRQQIFASVLERLQGRDFPPRQILLTGRLVQRASSQKPVG